MTPDEREITTSEAETNDDHPPPPPTAPYPKSECNPLGPPPRDEWIEQRVWDAWEQRYDIKWMKVRFVSINREPEIPPLFPVFQKQVDEYLEKERKSKEDEAYKNIKKEEEAYKKTEYDTPYKKLSIPTELIEGHEDRDDHFHGIRDWEDTFVKTTEVRRKNSPWLYPNAYADIFNDGSDFDDARSEETDFEDAADDSEYDPAEDDHDQDAEDFEEEITWAGDHEEAPAQDFDVVIPEQSHDAEDHHDHDDHPEHYQRQDDLKNLMPVVRNGSTDHEQQLPQVQPARSSRLRRHRIPEEVDQGQGLQPGIEAAGLREVQEVRTVVGREA